MQEKTLDIRVGHSPDPDDAFMFYALARGKIDTGRYRFTHEMADIESLNRRAETGELEVSAISIHQYPFIREHYAMLACGCSMGDGYGPMIVARRPMQLSEMKSREGARKSSSAETARTRDVLHAALELFYDRFGAAVDLAFEDDDGARVALLSLIPRRKERRTAQAKPPVTSTLQDVANG